MKATVAPHLAGFLLLALASACGSPQPTQSESAGVTVKVVEACTDGTATFLHLETNVDTHEWPFQSPRFALSGPVYFETAINLMQDGSPFSSTSSGGRTDPVVNPLTRMAVVTQDFVYPGTPSPASQFSLDATVTFSNTSDSLEVPGTFHLEFPVSTCP